MNANSKYDVFYEATPNPQALKFVVTSPISSGMVNFASANETSRSPLARKIFGFPWAAGVFIGTNFVTITKQEWVDWDILADPLSELIKEHLDRGEAVLTPEPVSAASSTGTAGAGAGDSNPVIEKIKAILEDEIRPAVAMDGGDVTFSRFEQGRVYLHMQGACSGCPSSSYTLKEGIESRLRAAVPEVLEVVAE